MLEFFCVILISAGLVFFLGAVIGLVRFPDFYTRMHAAGKGDTLSTLLILAGFGLYALKEYGAWPEILVIGKILLICVFIMVTSPTSTHALMQAGYDEVVKPIESKETDEKEVTQ